MKHRERNDVEAFFSKLDPYLEGGVKHLLSIESTEVLVFMKLVSLIARKDPLNRILDSDLH